MYLSIFENYEILGNLSHKMPLQSRCGELFVEILNNYSSIEASIWEAIHEIDKNRKRVISSYSKPFLSSDKNSYNINFLYDTIQLEFGNIFDDFQNHKSHLTDILNSLNEEIRLCRRNK